MGILSDFEDRIATGIEGVFAGAFRSPVQPAEIAKMLAKAMDDGRVVGVGAAYAPTAYTVSISEQDADKLGNFTQILGGELATYLVDHAREHGYKLSSRPVVEFVTRGELRLGRFKVTAELTSPTSDVPRAAVFARDSNRPLATVTVGDHDHDVVLQGDRVIVGRLAECGVCVSDVNVSRKHAAFVREGDSWWIEDLESTNGTRLNSHPIGRARLRDGDVVEVGVTRLIFHGTGD